MAGRRNRTGWRGMVRVLEGVKREGSDEPYFTRVAPGVLKKDERNWPAVVWIRTGGETVAALEGSQHNTEVLLAFFGGSFVAAEDAREKGLAALEQANLLAGPPDPPYDEYDDELEDGEDEGAFVVMQEVLVR